MRHVFMIVFGLLVAYMPAQVSQRFIYLPSYFTGLPPEHAVVDVASLSIETNVSYGHKVKSHYLWIRQDDGLLKKVLVTEDAYQLAAQGQPVHLEKHVTSATLPFVLFGICVGWAIGGILVLLGMLPLMQKDGRKFLPPSCSAATDQH